MTGHQINSLVGDLVAMAQAMERLPQVEAERDSANQVAAEREFQLGLSKADLQQARDYAATLEQKVRDLEVARDDAELRFLEAEDGKLAAVRAMRHIIDEAEGLIKVVEPPKPKPTPEPAKFDDGGPYNEPVISEVKPIDVDPTQPKNTNIESGDGNSSSHPSEYPSSTPLQGQSEPLPHSAPSPSEGVTASPDGVSGGVGQSEADPTTSSTTAASTEATQASVNTAPSTSATVPSSSHSEPKPYAGKTYSEVVGKEWGGSAIDYSAWIAGGGTISDWYK